MYRRLHRLLPALALALLAPLAAHAAPPAQKPAASADETTIPIVFGDPARPAHPAIPPEPSLIRWPKSHGPGFWPSAAAAVALTGLLLLARVLWARRRRACFQCGKKMLRQTPEATFAYLDAAEKVQAATGEVRYTLWRCPACGTEDLDAQVQPMPVVAGVRPTVSPLGLSTPPSRDRRVPSLLRLPKDEPRGDEGGEPQHIPLE